MSDVYALGLPSMRQQARTSSFAGPSSPMGSPPRGMSDQGTKTMSIGVGGGDSSGTNWGLLYAVPAAVSAALVVYHGAKLLIKTNNPQLLNHRRRSQTPQGGAHRIGGGSSEDDDANVRQDVGGGSPGRGVGAGRGNSPSFVPSKKSSNSLLQKNSRYKKGKLIGRGGFGSVYVGLDNETGEMIAIKEMDAAKGAAELKVEFDLLKDIRHEHVVAIKGFEIYGTKSRLYLEWVAGGSLSDIQEKYGQVPETRLKAYTKQILLGLGYLHQKGILHRDIKPGNILVDQRGCLKVTDFGLSRHLDSINPTTRTCGTVLYMAPECVKGHFAIGSDLWAVGATLVELASGKRPWSHLDKERIDNNFALMYHIAQLAGQRGHHPLIPPDLSPEGKDFLLQCFAPFSEDRGSCADLLQHPWLIDVSSPLARNNSTMPGADSAVTASSHTSSGGTTATATLTGTDFSHGTGTTACASTTFPQSDEDVINQERRQLTFEEADDEGEEEETTEEDSDYSGEEEQEDNEVTSRSTVAGQSSISSGDPSSKKLRRRTHHHRQHHNEEVQKEPTDSVGGLSSSKQSSTVCESPVLQDPSTSSSRPVVA